MLIRSGGKVIADLDSSRGEIGFNVNSRSNGVVVSDSDSRLSLNGFLFVGAAGNGNQLVISNGASADTVGASVGNANEGSNNLAMVTGANSSWTNRSILIVGGSGNNNRLIVSTGGTLVTSNTSVARVLACRSNILHVTDAGTIWDNWSDLILGHDGFHNQLVVSNGAKFATTRALVGYTGLSHSNSVLVTGAGTILTCSNDFRVGDGGGNNQLTVADGGTLVSSNGWLGFINQGFNAGLVTGAGSVWSNASYLIVGDASFNNQLTISEGGKLVSDFVYLGDDATSRSNVLLVTGTGSLVTNSVLMNLGVSGYANRLVVSNGAQVLSVDCSLGLFSSNNLALVTSPGSEWVADDLSVGSSGVENDVLVTNGGRVRSQRARLGYFGPSSGNQALVAGAGSSWTNDIFFYVGTGGDRNQLVVSNGGFVQSSTSEIGHDPGSGDNEAVVTGPGSIWQNRYLEVGSSGSSNRLMVVAGGTVSIGRTNLIGSPVGLVLGGQSSSSNNRVFVDGGLLRVTAQSPSAFLDVRRGTNVLNAGLIDADQLWLTNSQGFFEFNGGTLITRSVTINNGVPFTVGRGGPTPAIWDVRSNALNHALAGRLIVGSNASFNQVFVTNGATLTGGEYTFVAFSSGSNNAITVSGPGSTLNSPSGFFIGADGSANRMHISGGGKAIASLGNSGTFIGRSTGTRSNVVLVTDPSSRWSVNDFLYVGAGGNANLLVVSNGATTDSLIGYVGSATGGSNNLAIITGANSSWSNRSEFYVGSSGSGNRLVVSDGGRLINSNGYLASDLSSRSNVVEVTGPGSLWSNRANLFVGYDGTHNQLLVNNGAVVSVLGNLILGLNPTTSTGNRLVVDGSMLLVTNGSASGMLEIKRGTNLLNAGLIETDLLRMTNAESKLEFKGGTLAVKSSRVSIGNPLIVGDGTSPATLFLAGNGTHDFAGTLGLILTNNATLSGNGAVLAQLQVRTGARLAPGASVGKISFNAAPSFAGNVEMEISKNGAALTNDQIQLNNNGTLTYGGALTVTHPGPTALLLGDRFQLFIAGAYAGAFSAITLPPLPVPLSWTNKLLVDGSIEVIAPPAIAMSSGSYSQDFNSLSLSGGANPWRDNSTLLGWYAAKSVAPNPITNYIASDGSGNAGALYSFGSAGSPERALGSIGSGTPGNIAYAIAFANDTGASVSTFTITYTGEQWRNGGGVANTLTFWYRVSPAILTSAELVALTNWTAVTNLDFAAPSAVIPTGFALDGNLSTNRQTFSSVPIPGLTVPPGQNVFFRWHDADSTGTDQGMAVDDLVVDFSPVRPLITSVTVNPTNNFVLLTGLGESSVTYRFEAATNLTPPIFWERISTNAADNSGNFQMIDSNAPAFPVRFYRALSP